MVLLWHCNLYLRCILHRDNFLAFSEWKKCVFYTTKYSISSFSPSLFFFQFHTALCDNLLAFSFTFRSSISRWSSPRRLSAPRPCPPRWKAWAARVARSRLKAAPADASTRTQRNTESELPTVLLSLPSSCFFFQFFVMVYLFIFYIKGSISEANKNGGERPNARRTF